jgi:hypothetical protein
MSRWRIVASPLRYPPPTPEAAVRAGATTHFPIANDTSKGGNDNLSRACRIVAIGDRGRPRDDGRAGEARDRANRREFVESRGGRRRVALWPSGSLAAAVEKRRELREARGSFRPADAERDRLSLGDEHEPAGRARDTAV